MSSDAATGSASTTPAATGAAAPLGAGTPGAAPGATTTTRPAAPQPPGLDSWRSGFPTELRENQSFAQYEDNAAGLQKLANDYLNLQSKIGKKGVVLPKEGDEKDLERFYNELGRPAKPEDYDLSGFEVPESIKSVWNADAQAEMLASLHRRGLTNAQALGVIQDYSAHVSKTWEGVGEARRNKSAEIERELRGKWGRAYDERSERAALTANRLFGQEFLDRPDATGMPFRLNARFIEACARLGDDLSETPLLGGKAPRATLTPAEARTELNRLQADDGFKKALYDRDHPEHDAAVARRMALFEAANASA